MPILIDKLSKSFGSQAVLKGVTETFEAGEISILLGPSGCGKTTTLRCIAGLEQPTGGSIRVGEHFVYRDEPPVRVPTERRGISMVFQSYAIWPHMTVFENVALPLKAARTPRAEIRRRVAAALEMVGLQAVMERSATQLSGGQQQRVALARCIVSDSEFILMDEPLSNLDAKLRVAMRSEIRELQQRLGRTILFVTHDREEAMTIGDTVYLYRDGRVIRKGTPEAVYDHPHTRYAAEFLGAADLLPDFEWHVEQDAAVARLPGGIELPLGRELRPAPGQRLCVRPERWRVVEPASPGAIAARVTVRRFVGDHSEYSADTPLGELHFVERASRGWDVGAQIALAVDPADIRLVTED